MAKKKDAGSTGDPGDNVVTLPTVRIERQADPPPDGAARGPVPGAGETGVREIVREGRRKANKEKEWGGKDPPRGGEARVGDDLVPPGGWTPDKFGMAPGSPVQVLGMDGDVLHMIDAMGQLASVKPNELGQKFVQRLVGDRQDWLYWAFPRYDRNGRLVAWRNELFCEMVYTAAARRGLWSDIERVRGRGAWIDQNLKLVYHSGDAVYRQGQLARDGKGLEPIATGEIDDYFYPRRPAILAPWGEPINQKTNPALDIFRTLCTWKWERDLIDPFLLLGWIAAAMLGGALPWRPTCFVVGDRAVGKSTLNHLLKDIHGPGLHATADTTAAGIYQRVKQDSLPVAVDELEAGADNHRQMAVFRLARLAASGAPMFRGGADHTGTEFTARNCFFFSAINPPPLPPQDISRMVVLNLRKLPPETAATSIERMRNYSTGSMFLRRLIDEWHRFFPCYAAYRAALAQGGHDGRGQDTYGIALACADLLLGPEIMDELGFPVEDLGKWSQWLEAAAIPEIADAMENWRDCLMHLLTCRVHPWRDGSRQTVGQVLFDLENDKSKNMMELKDARNKLAQTGLGIIDARAREGRGGGGFILAIPNKSAMVSELFRDTVWGGGGGVGVWSSAFRQGPPEVVMTRERVAPLRGKDKKPENWNVVKVGGVPARCTLISLDGWNKLTEG